MLNLVEILNKKPRIKLSYREGRPVRLPKRDLPANKEWYNSVYAFNKNSTRFLPAVHDYVFKLLKSYFNATCKKLETGITTRKSRRLYLQSGRKVWISTPEIKHVNEKINVTIYVYNKIYNFYKKKLNLLALSWGPLNSVKIKKRFSMPLKKKTVKKRMIIKFTPLTTQQSSKVENIIFDVKTVKLEKITKNNNRKNKKSSTSVQSNLFSNKYRNYTKAKNFYIRIIKLLKSAKLISIKENLRGIANLLRKDNSKTLSKGLNLLKIKHQSYLINLYKKELLYLNLKQKILFNEFKFNELYLTPMVQFLQTIYKKKVEFNIVTLKHYFMSSSILSQILVTKIRNPIFRGRPLKPVYKSMGKIRTPNLSSNKIQLVPAGFKGIQNVIFNNTSTGKRNSLATFLLTNNETSRNIEELVLSNIENKGIAGVFIKISGRLTKRYKAERAVSKLRSKGSLKNMYSAYKGLSSSLSKGYANINVEKTMLHSNTRVGAFGLTGWVTSY